MGKLEGYNGNLGNLLYPGRYSLFHIRKDFRIHYILLKIITLRIRKNKKTDKKFPYEVTITISGTVGFQYCTDLAIAYST